MGGLRRLALAALCVAAWPAGAADNRDCDDINGVIYCSDIGENIEGGAAGTGSVPGNEPDVWIGPAEVPEVPPPTWHYQIPDAVMPGQATSNGAIQGIRPTRTFVGAQMIPPTGYAAYGIVAFPAAATPWHRQRYIIVCHSYWAALTEAGSAGIPTDEQMVTVWPVTDEAMAQEIIAEDDIEPGCADAVDNYHLASGQLAIDHANLSRAEKLDGRGPFLIAWSPSTAKGRPGVPVLIADLSGASTGGHFDRYFRKWRDLIQRRPDLWDEDEGFSAERIRVLIGEFVDSSGREILEYFNGQAG